PGGARTSAGLFACHCLADLDDILDSALIVEDGTISLAELLTIPAAPRRLAGTLRLPEPPLQRGPAERGDGPARRADADRLRRCGGVALAGRPCRRRPPPYHPPPPPPRTPPP